MAGSRYRTRDWAPRRWKARWRSRAGKGLREYGIALLRHGRQQAPALHEAAGFKFVGEIVCVAGLSVLQNDEGAIRGAKVGRLTTSDFVYATRRSVYHDPLEKTLVSMRAAYGP